MKKLLPLLSVLILALSGCKPTEPTTTTSPEATQLGATAIQATCPQQCKTMRCPPPNGISKLCCPVYPYTQTCP